MSEDIASLGLSIDSSGVIKATDSLSKLDDQSAKSEKANKNLSTSFKSLAATVGITAIAYKGVTAAISQWREFSSAISDLSAITGATGKDLEFLRKKSMEIGETTTLSASQAATAFKLIASAKPDLLESAEALAEVTKQTVLLAEAAGIDLTVAAETVGGSLNQFGAGAEAAARFVNVLAAGAKFGASEINLTAMALNEAGTVASSAGISFEETNAAIQSLAAVSIKGSKAGVALRNAIVNLRTRGVDETNPAIVGLSQALKNLGAEQLDTAELAKLFGKENLAAGEALLKSADSMDVLTEKLTGTQVAMTQARIKTNNLDGDIKRMGSQWEAAGILLGGTFDPAMRSVVQLMGDAADIAKSITIAIADMGDGIGAFAAQVAAVATFDFDAAEAIGKDREANKAANEEALAAIWAEKDATEQLTEAKIASTAVDTASREAEGEGKLELKIKENEEILALQAEADNQLLFQQALRIQESERIESEHAKARADIQKSMFGNLIGLMNSGSKTMFKIGKVAALSQAAIDLPAAITGAYKIGAGIGGPWMGAAYAATAGLAQLNNIQKIKSASFGGSGGGGATVSSTTGGNSVTGQIPSLAQPVPEAQAATARELRVVVEGDGPHSQGMRTFAENLAATIKDMGGVGTLTIS